MNRIDLGRKPERDPAAPLPLVERRDALPEHITYRDEGCELAPRCLECPLPRCKYDEPGGARRLRVETRDEALVAAWRRERLSVNELAHRYGISRRSVFRILKGAKRQQRRPTNDGAAAAGQTGHIAVVSAIRPSTNGTDTGGAT